MRMRLGLTCLLLTLAAAALAAPWGPLDLDAVRTRVANAPDPGPDEEGLILFEGRYYSHADGLTTLRHQRLLRVNSEWALERPSDPRLRYDTSRQTLEVHAARTYLPDGTWQDSPANAFNRVTPGALAQAVDFLDIQELVVTHTGLVPGAVLWLDYELRDTAPAGLPAGELIFPHGEFPKLQMEIVAEGLHGERVNPEGGLFQLPDGDGRWQFENLASVQGFPRHRRGDQLPQVRISPAASWEEVLSALSEAMDAALADTTGLAAWLDTFQEEEPFLSDREAVETWLDGMGDRFASLRFDDWHWRRPPRTVARVLATSVATPLERAAVFAAAAGARGLEARTWTLRPSSGIHSGDLLPLASIERIFASIETGTRADSFLTVDLDAGKLVDSRTPLLRGAYAFGTPGQFRRIETEPSSLRMQGKSYFGFDAADFKASASIDRLPAAAADLSEPREFIENWLEADSTEVEAVSLLSCSAQSLRFEAEGRTGLPAPREDGTVRLRLALPPAGFEQTLPPGLDRRRSAQRGILFPLSESQIHLAWILDLPADMEALPVEPIGASCAGGSFTAARTLDGDRLTVTYDLEFSTPRIGPADYPAFRAFVNAALDPAATRVILRPNRED